MYKDFTHHFKRFVQSLGISNLDEIYVPDVTSYLQFTGMTCNEVKSKLGNLPNLTFSFLHNETHNAIAHIPLSLIHI